MLLSTNISYVIGVLWANGNTKQVVFYEKYNIRMIIIVVEYGYYPS
jgi:hypothetical protein